jgi:hypothetical protein
MLDHSAGAASAFNETISLNELTLLGKTGLKRSNPGVLNCLLCDRTSEMDWLQRPDSERSELVALLVTQRLQ